jgi:thioredoxin-like negative regulator of GroEL
MGTQLLYFTADWCVPCKTYGPLLYRVAGEEMKLTIVRLDVDENQDMVEEYKIMSVPTVIVMKEGTVAAFLAGALTEGQLRTALAAHV